MKDLETKQGAHLTVTKKEFCKLIKKATLQHPKELDSTKPLPAEQVPK
jgi:hypothetical protein